MTDVFEEDKLERQRKARRAKTAIKKYGELSCLKAAFYHHVKGYGASGIALEVDCPGVRTTNQADAAIDAGSWLVANGTPPYDPKMEDTMTAKPHPRFDDRPTVLHFEDKGQDFLWWEIDKNGLVVDCGPSQSWVWVGSTVDVSRIYDDDRVVHFTTKDCETTTLNYLMVDITHDMYEVWSDEFSDLPLHRSPRPLDEMARCYLTDHPKFAVRVLHNGVETARYQNGNFKTEV